MPDLASAPIDAPALPIDTPFRRNAQPQTCYVGLTTFTQGYAHPQGGAEVTADVLFMHPPARVTLSHPIYADHPVLHFLHGLDPNVRELGTDGATFQVWVQPASSPAVLVYERTVAGTTGRQGWVAGWADLSRWAGQTVRLVLRTTGGPANNLVGDWYGWGNVTLTTREAAQYSLIAPEARMRRSGVH